MSTQLSLLTSVSSAEDSPARTSAPQELAKGLLAAARACGISSLASYPPSARRTPSSRTSQVRLADGWKTWRAPWDSSVTSRYRCLCRRGAAALPTPEHASFCLPTLTKSTYGSSNNGCPHDGREAYATAGKPSLHTLVRRMHEDIEEGLVDPARPTYGPTLLGRGPRMAELFSGALSPTWCEQYMGFPIGWTALPRSETPSCPTAPKSPGTSFDSSKDGEP